MHGEEQVPLTYFLLRSDHHVMLHIAHLGLEGFLSPFLITGV